MYDVDIKLTSEISEEIRRAFINRLNKVCWLVHTDYCDDFGNSGKIIQECIDENNGDKFFEIYNTWLSESADDGADYEIGEIERAVLSDNKLGHLHPFLEEWLDTYDNKDTIREMIQEKDMSEPKEMIGRTRLRARAQLHTNYDCLVSNWDLGNTYEYSDYFKDIVDVLNLNPYWVKKKFQHRGIHTTGRFPNLKKRDGKEAVAYDDFATELLNQCSYSLLTFAGMLPLDELYKNHFGKITHITIPKDNFCGMFSDWRGGGSLMEMKLLRDLTIPVSWKNKTKYDSLDLYVDEVGVVDYCYCINQVYGMCMSFWNKPLCLTFEKEEKL